jgi:deoxyribose-phosphate aldolase
MTPRASRSVAARALPLLDLTDLGEAMTAADADRLCDRAVGPSGSVAAVCLWPRFVARAKAKLARSGVRVATVVNFPAGGDDAGAVVAETKDAIADGADEVDAVLPWRALRRGDAAAAERLLRAVRKAVPRRRRLKVILETGELKDPALIGEACRLALAAGADFLKTSTGKTPVGATPEAVRIMLRAIRGAGRPVGLKVAGGVRTLADAAAYLSLAGRMMGAGWVSPATFRFGASGLLDALEAALAGRAPAPPARGY